MSKSESGYFDRFAEEVDRLLGRLADKVSDLEATSQVQQVTVEALKADVERLSKWMASAKPALHDLDVKSRNGEANRSKAFWAVFATLVAAGIGALVKTYIDSL